MNQDSNLLDSAYSFVVQNKSSLYVALNAFFMLLESLLNAHKLIYFCKFKFI